MEDFSLIANTGIHMLTFPLEIDPQQKFKLWFHEWYDKTVGEWKLSLAEQVAFETGLVFYDKKKLCDYGYINFANIAKENTYSNLKEEGLLPIADENGMLNNNTGELFKMTFNDKYNALHCFENVWLPAPYFWKRTEKMFKFGPFNWVRFKLVPSTTAPNDGKKHYNVLMAFDTRTKYKSDGYNEYPVFPAQYEKLMNFELCSNEFFLMDYCSPSSDREYIDNYLMKLVHPDIQRVSQLRGEGIHKLSYIASYVYLIDYLAQNDLFPKVVLYKDTDVTTRGVDMIVDIGNSRTTVLLREENAEKNCASRLPFTQVPRLQLTNYTHPLETDNEGITNINRNDESFDMRLAFRKVDFGHFGISDSLQFVYPSFVRLGQEANELIHLATMSQDSLETLSTYSSPKRYLWDAKPNKEEWRFMSLPGEYDDTILNINGVSKYLENDGRIVENGTGGITYHYSRRTLMTFSFMEMLLQAQVQINGYDHRKARGNRETPRCIKRIVVTCPTAMSKTERNALTECAKDAVTLLSKFDNSGLSPNIEIVPNYKQYNWYYDEATCAQLVYMYGEVGYKYKGCCSEFFNLYGKCDDGDKQNSLTLASLDIGAGTSDLMISKYTYERGDITRITPDPVFYDSFYYAGDDMLEALIKNVMYMSQDSALYQQVKDKLTFEQFLQSMKDFVGPDYHGQTMEDRIIRRDFNIQYSIPLMYHFLELVKQKHENCVVHYDDVFAKCEPNSIILDYFENRFVYSLKSVDWEFKYNDVCAIISKEFEPLLKKIATIMFAHACDIVLLSGRPASLQPIRDILLKYYCVAPNRLILLNNYFVGDWYPYDNNTGYIVDSKPIVAVGAAVAHYAAELSSLNNFVIMTDKLQENLKSTVNFIEASREGQPVTYFITPQKHIGDLAVSSLPTNINVRQLGMDSYPARTLYTIDFNRMALDKKIRNKANEDGYNYSDAHIYSMVEDEIDGYRKRLPFKITIERDPSEMESLSITEIVDRNDVQLSTKILDLHIQSLGADEKYWLDSGAFAF